MALGYRASRDGRQNWVTICTPTGARISWQPFQATETENMHVFRVKRHQNPTSATAWPFLVLSLFLQQGEARIAHFLPIHLHLQSSTCSWGLVAGFRTQIQVKRTNWTHSERAPWWCALFMGKVPKEMYRLHHAELETAFKVNKNESTRKVEVIKLALCVKNNVFFNNSPALFYLPLMSAEWPAFRCRPLFKFF